MKLSEVPEGVKTEASIEGESDRFLMTVRDGFAYYPGGMRSSVSPCRWTVVESADEIATLKARIAELEAKLAKTTRPEPAVGQVWRDLFKREFCVLSLSAEGVAVIVTEYGEYDNEYRMGSTDTYRGQFVGFKIEEDGE